MNNRVTLADVANLAGVSKTSASMALAGNTRVADSTRETVRRAAAQLGYVPHFAASSLRSHKADTIAVALPHDVKHVFSHPVFIEMLEGVASVANELDLSVLLSTARSSRDEESAYSRIIRGRQAAGVIVAAASIHDNKARQIHDSGFPVVIVGRIPRSTDVTSVYVDDLGGSEAAVRHLIESHGVRRIGHVSGPLDHQSSIDKRDGYERALASAGLVIDPRLTYEGDYDEASGHSAARALLASLQPGDGMFFANDQMAIGAIQEWQAAGLEVPRDIKIVAYDDHPLSRYSTPRLTTVGADMVEVGEAAMRSLVSLIAGESVTTPIEFPTRLIVRESCGCTGAP